MCAITSTFLGSGFISSFDIMCLKKGISDACILSLSGLNFQFFSLALSSSVSVAS